MGFFGGMPFPVQFFLAFIIVLGLIGATAWAVRRFGAGRLGSVGLRGRQPRLAVVDYASVDARRRLLLIRRDNVEHLVMIGGPTDVVVETNIVRASAAQRDIAVPRPPAAVEALPRVIASPDGVANGSWATPAEPAVPLAVPRTPRAEPMAEEPMVFPFQTHAETPRANRETLAALADELTPKPAMPPRSRPQAPLRPQPPEPPRQESRHEPRSEPRQELRQEPRQELRPESRQEPRQESRQESRHEPRISVAHSDSEEAAAATDQNLAEMAHRLEAALRRPSAKSTQSPAPEPRSAPMPRAPMPAEQMAAADAGPAGPQIAAAPAPMPSRSTRFADAKSPRGEAKSQRADGKQSNAAGKSLYDSLEQEMASLLGRSTAKN